MPDPSAPREPAPRGEQSRRPWARRSRRTDDARPGRRPGVPGGSGGPGSSGGSGSSAGTGGPDGRGKPEPSTGVGADLGPLGPGAPGLRGSTALDVPDAARHLDDADSSDDAGSSDDARPPDDAGSSDEPGAPAPAEAAVVLADVLQHWSAELALVAGSTSLRDDRAGRPGGSDVPAVDLAVAHPSGLAQFWAGRPTRLSSLVREPGAHAQAQERSRGLRATAAEVVEQHGVDPCALGYGLVRWQAPETADAGATELHAPAFLQPVTVRSRGSGSPDEELELAGDVRLNPVLRRVLGERGYRLDEEAALAPFADGLGDPYRRALRALREMTVGVPGCRVSDRAVVGLYLDLAASLLGDLEAQQERLAASPLVWALAGDRPRPSARAAAQSADQAVVPAVAAWGPDGSRCVVLDLDGDQRGALDAVLAGESVRLEAPPGTGATQLLAQVLVSAAATGRRVLLVAPSRSEITDTVARLEDVGLGVLATGAGIARSAPQHDLVDLPEDAVARARAAVTALRAGQRALDGGAPGLRTSAREVLHRLTLLERPEEGQVPTSPVRLPPEDVRAVAAEGVADVVELVRTAARLGAFDAELRSSPWYGAALTSGGQAREALERASRVSTSALPQLRSRMRVLGERTGLAEPRTLAEVDERLHLLVDVRSTLDLFVPALHEHPLADLSARLAPTGSWTDRRRARREAAELVRPGRRVPDLHAAVARADAEQRAWVAAAQDDGGPRVPSGIGDAQRAVADLDEELALLGPVLAPTSPGEELRALDLDELAGRVGALAADPDARDRLPQRVDVLVHLTSLGLGELLAGLAAAGASPEQAGRETERVWWSSALATLLAQGWLDEVAPGRADALREDLRRARGQVVSAVADDLAAGTHAPAVRTASPLTVPSVLAGQRGALAGADLVVVAGAHGAGVAESVLSLVRGAQVLLVGDLAGPGPVRGVLGSGSAERSAGRRTSLWQASEGLLVGHTLGHQHRMPAELLPVVAAVREQAVQTSSDGTDVRQDGVPAPASAPALVHRRVSAERSSADTPRSSAAEVDEVVAVVSEHARTSPEQSVAVLAVTREHARRVADALRAALPRDPRLAEVLTRRGREPFVVTDVTRAEGCERDVVVLATAYTRGRGRSTEGFGPLDAPGGEKTLACAASRARRRLHVVTGLSSRELPPDRLRTPGALALRDLLAVVEERAQGGAGPGAEPGDGSRAGTGDRTGDGAGTAPADLDPLLAELVGLLLDAGVRARPAGAPGDPDVVVVGPTGSAAVLGDAGPSDPVERVEQGRRLARRGWAVVHAGSLELALDPGAVAGRVLSLVGRP